MKAISGNDITDEQLAELSRTGDLGMPALVMAATRIYYTARQKAERDKARARCAAAFRTTRKDKPMTLKPGSYRLSRDVKNPTPDRRHKDDWSKWPVWEAGTEFIALERSHSLPIDDPDLTDEQRASLRAKDRYIVIRMVGPRFASLYERGPGNEEQYKVLVEALAPCSESIDAMFERLGVRDEYFAQWLVESGRLDRQTFERLWSAYDGDGSRTQAEGLAPGRRLVEEPSAEELGVEPDIEALNRLSGAAVRVCRSCRNPLPHSGERRECRGRSEPGSWCSE